MAPPADAADSVRTPYYRAPPDAAPAQAPAPGKKKKAAKDHIPRPANAFILFRADFTKNHKLPDGIEKNNGSLSKIASSEWKSLSPEARRFWDERAEDAKKEHQAMYPDYKYRPVHGKNSKHKPKELVGVWKDSEKEAEAPKEEEPHPPADDRWMEGCSTFSVWKADGDDSKRGRGRPPKGLKPPPPKKGSIKPSSSSSQPGPEASAEEQEAYERRCAYLAQLSARGVSGEAFESAKQAWDDAHRLKPSRASSSGHSNHDADATEDEGPESESETEGARRRAMQAPPPPPPPGNAPPRIVSSAGSSFTYDRPLPPALYSSDAVRSAFAKEMPPERPPFRPPTPEKAISKEASPEPEAERIADYPRSFARGEGAPPVPSLSFTHTPGEPPRRDSFVRGSDEPADVEMQDAGMPAPPSSKRKRSPYVMYLLYLNAVSPTSRRVTPDPEDAKRKDSSPLKRARHDDAAPHIQAPAPVAHNDKRPLSPSRASSLTTADGEYDADGDYDMEDGGAEEDEDGIESEDTEFEDGHAKPKPKPRIRARAKAHGATPKGRGSQTPKVARGSKKPSPRLAATMAGRV
ncbi:hypothetical protein HDZ31DRAFT_42694 [Schizophyllum fasciatum]